MAAPAGAPPAAPPPDDPNNYMGTGMSQAAYFAALAAAGQNSSAAASAAGNAAVTPDDAAKNAAVLAAMAAGGRNASGAAGAAGDAAASQVTVAQQERDAAEATPSLDRYGRFTSGPYAGLTQAQADTKVAAALQTHGGYSFKPDEYKVNYGDGSITVVKTPANGNYPNLTPGMTVDQSGNIFMPDGSQQVSPTTGKQAQVMFGVSGQPSDTYNKDVADTPALTNLLEGHPIEAGGKVVGDAASAVSSGLKDIGNALGLGSGGSGSGGGGITTGDADAETNRANALADALGGQAGTAGAQADADRGLGAQTRAQQQDSIAGLTAAANGTAPSAAELQLKQQSGIDAARQYGLAAALQGNNPGAALRQASLGAAQIAGTTNQNAAINRANEQATARGQLASTLAGVRQGDQSAVTTDVGQQGQLTQGQLTSQGQGVTSTGQKLTAQTEEEKADALKEGALLGAGASGLATLISDKRAKRDIVKTDLADALAKGVHGVSFTYRPEAEEDDEPHFGILADALERVIPGVVKKGPSGFKEVDTGHLTLGNTAILSELARRLQDLEKGARK